MQFVKKSMVQDLVHVFLNTTEILTLYADLSALKTPTAIGPKLVSIKNAKIPVQESVETMPYVTL
jgi:hypothetical protein